MYAVRADQPAEAIYHFQKEYSEGPITTPTPNSNFLKGVKWSPDGVCLLTASDDNWFRIYDTPPDACAPPTPAAQLAGAGTAGAAAGAAGAAAAADTGGGAGSGSSSAHAAAEAAAAGGSREDSFPPALRLEEGELIYDYAWFPRMLASDPLSCVFASTSRAHPLHLWDACTGELRCTYRAYDAVDEVTAAYSLAFDPEGAKLFAGYTHAIRSFDVARPGRDYATIVTHQKRQEGLPGIISCLAFNPDRSGMLAAGSYSCVAALYDAAAPARASLICLLQGHTGGITQVQFSADGNFLYTGARRDPALHCWDVRYTSGVVYTLPRASATTNQRIQFDIEPCGRHLASGGEDGIVRLFDLRDGQEVASFQAADDTVNGVHFNPHLPLLATASGHRQFFLAASLSDDSSGSDSDSEGSSSSSMSEDGGPQPVAGSFESGAQLGAEQAERGAASQDGATRAVCRLGSWENVLRIWRLPAEILEQQQQPEQQQHEMDGLEQEQQQEEEGEEEDMGLEQGREERWAEDAAASC